MEQNVFSRRRFLTTAGVALGTTTLIGSKAYSANEKISVGIIGAGERGSALMSDICRLKDSHNVAITAVCDIWKVNLESSAEKVERCFGYKPFSTTRFGEVVARGDIDAVVIATPDFGHAPIMIEALQAGKDVYVEKPMSIDLEEAKRAFDLARERGRVVQVGTQRRSEGRWKAAREFIASGTLGTITRVSSSVCFNHPRWARDVSNCKEEDVDWEAYLFNRPKVAFDPNLLRRWHLYKLCTNGLSGLWMCHLVDAAHIVMNASYPNAAVALGGIYLWKDGREHTDVFHALLDYPEGFLFDWSMSLTNASGNRYSIHGRYGTMDLDKLRYSSDGGEEGHKIEPGTLTAYPDENHMANWLDCIRSRNKPNGDIEYGYQHSVATIMAAQAFETGQRMKYDRENRVIYAG